MHPATQGRHEEHQRSVQILLRFPGQGAGAVAQVCMQDRQLAEPIAAARVLGVYGDPKAPAREEREQEHDANDVQ